MRRRRFRCSYMRCSSIRRPQSSSRSSRQYRFVSASRSTRPSRCSTVSRRTPRSRSRMGIQTGASTPRAGRASTPAASWDRGAWTSSARRISTSTTNTISCARSATMPPTYVIAELGIAHEGDRDTWRRLIDVAVEAGADAIKGQYWSDSLKMATHRGRGGEAAWFEHYRMPAEWLHDIPTSVEAMCTVYLRDDLLLDWFWHDESAPIVVSTGGWSHAQLNGRRRHKRFEYLHCIPQYPTLAKEMALSMIHRYGL